MDSVDLIASINNEDDNFSDTDNEEQWEKESMLPPVTQTTYVWERSERMEIASVGNSVLLPGN